MLCYLFQIGESLVQSRATLLQRSSIDDEKVLKKTSVLLRRKRSLKRIHFFWRLFISDRNYSDPIALSSIYICEKKKTTLTPDVVLFLFCSSFFPCICHGLVFFSLSLSPCSSFLDSFRRLISFEKQFSVNNFSAQRTHSIDPNEGLLWQAKENKTNE